MDLERLKIDRGTSGTPHLAATAPERPRRRWPWGWTVVLVLVALALWLFRRPFGTALDRLRLPAVQVVRVTRSSALTTSAVSGTSANGYVVARHRAALSADTPGRIVEMNVEEGSVVHAGDVVARLYSDEYEAALRRAEADLQATRSARERSLAQIEAARTRLSELGTMRESAAARHTEAQASLRLAEANATRLEQLVDDGVVSVDELDRVRAARDEAAARLVAAEADSRGAEGSLASGQADVTVAEASAREAEDQIAVLEAERDQALATLEKTVVRAPFDGVVVLKDAEVGEVVSPNSQGAQSRGSVATIVDFASLEVQVEVPETSIAAVALDTPVAIYLDAFPDVRYDGRVTRIWPTANRQKATVEVRVAFERTDERLRPEMGARAVFSPGREAGPGEAVPPGAILLSADALVTVDGSRAVFVLERDVVRLRTVRAGGERSGRVVVEQGLEDGELVVMNPPHSLADGDRVRVL